MLQHARITHLTGQSRSLRHHRTALSRPSVCVCAHTRNHTQANMHAHSLTHVAANAHAHTHSRTRTRTHTPTPTHTQGAARTSSRATRRFGSSTLGWSRRTGESVYHSGIHRSSAPQQCSVHWAPCNACRHGVRFLPTRCARGGTGTALTGLSRSRADPPIRAAGRAGAGLLVLRVRAATGPSNHGVGWPDWRDNARGCNERTAAEGLWRGVTRRDSGTTTS